MDFAAFSEVTDAHEAGREVKILAPDGTETDSVFTVVGVQSRAYRRGRVAATVALRTLGEVPEDQRVEAWTVAALSRCVVAWKGVEWKGKPLKCTPENVAKLLAGVPWIADQIERAVHDEAGFSKASSKPA